MRKEEINPGDDWHEDELLSWTLAIIIFLVMFSVFANI